MRLQSLIKGFPVRVSAADGDPLLTDLTDDSRRVTPGAGFVARTGSGDDGRRYIADARRRGAAAVIEADDPRTVARLAERFFGEPGQKLRLVGVTGTNGKSTLCFLVQHLLAAAGVKCGLIGTILIDDGRRRQPAELTTPGPIEFSRHLAAMVAHGCTAAACEVSSHALHQGRVAALRFDAAIFTNLTGDHLDYHHTMDAYADAKALLFESLDEQAWAIVNRDDAYAPRMVRDCRAKICWTTLGAAEGEKNLCRAVIQSLAGDHSRATFEGPWGAVDATLPLPGRHNVCNALQAVAAGNCITALARTLRQSLPDCPQVPGRLQRVTLDRAADLPTVLVDYAHTHDSLQNVLGALRPIVTQRRGRLICVFGCGGDRDRTKRPRMAQVAVSLADVVIVTSDNPRTEDAGSIISDILAGVPTPMPPTVIVQIDRAAAIAAAIAQAQPNDTVLLAGKGHEDYQILPDPDHPGSTRKIHFDDREHAAEALKKKTPASNR